MRRFRRLQFPTFPPIFNAAFPLSGPPPPPPLSVADEMYAKEKARIKRELKLRAEAAATAKAVKAGSSRK